MYCVPAGRAHSITPPHPHTLTSWGGMRVARLRCCSAAAGGSVANGGRGRGSEATLLLLLWRGLVGRLATREGARASRLVRAAAVEAPASSSATVVLRGSRSHTHTHTHTHTHPSFTHSSASTAEPSRPHSATPSSTRGKPLSPFTHWELLTTTARLVQVDWLPGSFLWSGAGSGAGKSGCSSRTLLMSSRKFCTHSLICVTGPMSWMLRSLESGMASLKILMVQLVCWGGGGGYCVCVVSMVFGQNLEILTLAKKDTI